MPTFNQLLCYLDSVSLLLEFFLSSPIPLPLSQFKTWETRIYYFDFLTVSSTYLALIKCV